MLSTKLEGVVESHRGDCAARWMEVEDSTLKLEKFAAPAAIAKFQLQIKYNYHVLRQDIFLPIESSQS